MNMKVIVKVAGFYGGTWHDAGSQPVEMHAAIARPFLPPYGDQLARPVEPDTRKRGTTKDAGATAD